MVVRVQLISLDELAKHAKEGDQWTAIHGIVYDVTEWIPDHPGGDALLGQYAGKVSPARTSAVGRLAEADRMNWE